MLSDTKSELQVTGLALVQEATSQKLSLKLLWTRETEGQKLMIRAISRDTGIDREQAAFTLHSQAELQFLFVSLSTVKMKHLHHQRQKTSPSPLDNLYTAVYKACADFKRHIKRVQSWYKHAKKHNSLTIHTSWARRIPRTGEDKTTRRTWKLKCQVSHHR